LWLSHMKRDWYKYKGKAYLKPPIILGGFFLDKI